MTPDVADARYLVWPERQRPPSVELPDDYAIRTYQQDDRDALLDLLQAHWPLTDDELQDYLDHILPNGLFLVETRDHGELVGAAGAVHNPDGGDQYFPFGGEVGYLYVAESHRRQGIGYALASAATRRLDAAGYTSIRAGTQNPIAVLLFLNLAYQPFAPSSDAAGSWRPVYDELGIPFDRDRVVTP